MSETIAKRLTNKAENIRNLIGIRADVNDMLYVSKEFLAHTANLCDEAADTLSRRQK